MIQVAVKPELLFSGLLTVKQPLKPRRIDDPVVAIALVLYSDIVLNQSVKWSKIKPTKFTLVVEVPLRVVEVRAIVKNADATE